MNINWDSKVLHSIRPVIENLENVSIDHVQLTNEAKKLSTVNYEIKVANNND